MVDTQREVGREGCDGRPDGNESDRHVQQDETEGDPERPEDYPKEITTSRPVSPGQWRVIQRVGEAWRLFPSKITG